MLKTCLLHPYLETINFGEKVVYATVVNTLKNKISKKKKRMKPSFKRNISKYIFKVAKTILLLHLN